MSLFEFVLLREQDRRRGSRLARVKRLRSNTGATLAPIERSANEFYEPVVIDGSSRSHDEIAVRELASVKTHGSFVIESRNCFSCALDRTAKRLIREVSGVEELAEELVRRVFDHLHLFEDHLLLAFQRSEEHTSEL